MTEFPQIREHWWSVARRGRAARSKKKRWRLQFNLRTLLAAMAILGLVFAAWSQPVAVAVLFVPAMPIASIACMMLMDSRRWWLGLMALFCFFNFWVAFAGLFVGGNSGLMIIGVSLGIAVFLVVPLFAGLIIYSFVVYLFEAEANSAPSLLESGEPEFPRHPLDS